MVFDKKLSKHLPKHVAFIMDGNRRWAKNKNFQIIDGHKKGSEIVKNIVRKSLELGIKYLTFFQFFNRKLEQSDSEILKLQSLLKFYLKSEKEIFINEKLIFFYW